MNGFLFDTHVFDWILAPFVSILTYLAQINIDVSTLEIHCHGAQQPLYLLLTIIITGIVIIIIKSDMQIFWTFALDDLINKTQRLVLNRYYLSHNFRLAMSNSLLAGIIGLVVPEPRKWIQYMLGFVSISRFFARDGFGESSDVCNESLWNLFGIKYRFPSDKMLAIATTIFAVFVFSLMLFQLSQILVPTFEPANVADATVWDAIKKKLHRASSVVKCICIP